MITPTFFRLRLPRALAGMITQAVLERIYADLP